MSNTTPTTDAVPDRRQPSSRRPDSTEPKSDALPARNAIRRGVIVGGPCHDRATPKRYAQARSGTRPPFNEVSVLFPLLSIYTAGYLGLMIADFFLKRSLALPDGIMTIYIALLGAYAADKEIRRWLGTPEPPRKGSIFVYLWLLFALVAFIIHSFRADYLLPNNLITVCLQVLGIFFGSKASKYVCEKRSGSGEADPGRERLVLDMLAAKGQITRQMVSDELQISRSVVGRLLSGMEAKGTIVRKGEGKGCYYVLAPTPHISD